VRFKPVSAAALTPIAMQGLHDEFRRALDAGVYEPLLLCAAYILDFTVIHSFREHFHTFNVAARSSARRKARRSGLRRSPPAIASA
jgi:hypothetical protein